MVPNLFRLAAPWVGKFYSCKTPTVSIVVTLGQRSPTFMKLRDISRVLFIVKGYQFDAHFRNKKFTQFIFDYAIIN